MLKIIICLLFFNFMLFLIDTDASGVTRKLLVVEQLLFRIKDKSFYISDFREYIDECSRYKLAKKRETKIAPLLVDKLTVKNYHKLGKEKINLREISFQIYKYIYFIKMKIYLQEKSIYTFKKELLKREFKDSFIKFDKFFSEKIRLFSIMEKYFLERFVVKSRDVQTKSSEDSVQDSLKLFLINLDRKITHNVFF